MTFQRSHHHGFCDFCKATGPTYYLFSDELYVITARFNLVPVCSQACSDCLCSVIYLIGHACFRPPA